MVSQRVRQDRATKRSTVMCRSYYLLAQLVKNLPVMQETTFNVGDMGSMSRLGRCPGEGNGNTLQNICLANPVDKGAWQTIVLGVTKVGHDLATKPPLEKKGERIERTIDSLNEISMILQNFQQILERVRH